MTGAAWPVTAIPRLVELGEDTLPLVRIAARHCLLPDPETVALFACAVFPSIRDQRNRITAAEINGRPVLLDDNATARWALLWSHGIAATHHPKGWTFAHVWGAVKDPAAYTNLANLVMMPEYLASLSDKEGPLARFLRYHAWHIYGWRPSGAREPDCPQSFDTIEWRYLRKCSDPFQSVRDRINGLKNQRAVILQTMMRDGTDWWQRRSAAGPPEAPAAAPK